MTDDKVIIHTDGACSGNPGPGGWGAILEYNGKRKELAGGEPATTNNRMELMAAIGALEALKRPCKVEMHTDSNYLKDGISKWIHSWKRNGWKTAAKKPVKNAELWQRLDAALHHHDVSWHWVRGHSGHDLNERADELAREGMAPFKRKPRKASTIPKAQEVPSSRRKPGPIHPGDGTAKRRSGRTMGPGFRRDDGDRS